MLKYVIIWGLLFAGCQSRGNTVHVDSAADTAIDSADTSTSSDLENGNTDAGDTAIDTANYERPVIFSKYGNINTVAGACSIEDKGVNGWQDSFEGGDATVAELSRPHYAMADAEGNIYIADKDAHAVRMVTSDGTIHTIAGTGESGDGPDSAVAATQCALSAPNGLWVLEDGTVYIVDLNNSKIRRLTPNGNIQTVVTDPDGISLGRAVWVSENESVIYYSSGSVVKKWTEADGVTVFADGFSGLGALMIAPDGNLMVTDRDGNAVYRVSQDGVKNRVAGTGSASSSGSSGSPATDVAMYGVRGIWVLEDGDYFVATHEGSQVWYVDTNGIIHLFVDGSANGSHSGDGEPFDTPGLKISEARGIACDRNGNLIITENDCGYIRVVERIAQ